MDCRKPERGEGEESRHSPNRVLVVEADQVLTSCKDRERQEVKEADMRQMALGGGESGVPRLPSTFRPEPFPLIDEDTNDCHPQRHSSPKKPLKRCGGSLEEDDVDRFWMLSDSELEIAGRVAKLRERFSRPFAEDNLELKDPNPCPFGSGIEPLPSVTSLLQPRRVDLPSGNGGVFFKKKVRSGGRNGRCGNGGGVSGGVVIEISSGGGGCGGKVGNFDEFPVGI